MSTIAQSARLERALRFSDLAINAAAIPLPVDLMPSAVPQDAVPDDAVPGDAANDMRGATHDTQAAQSAPEVQSPQSSTADPSVPDVAVLNSLQAAIDAVHDSLHETSAGMQETPASSEPAVADLVSADVLPSTTQSIASSAEPALSRATPQDGAAI